MNFHIFQSEENQRYYFHLKARNGQIVLSSQGYQSKQGAQKGVEAVKRRGKDESSYIANTSKNQKHYFVLTAKNGRIIGTSQLYSSISSLKKTMSSIMMAL